MVVMVMENKRYGAGRQNNKGNFGKKQGRKFFDKIIVLADKTIREVGSHEELMERNGIYAEMFRTQAKWYVEKV